MTTSPDARGIAAALDELRDSIDDGAVEHDLLNTLSYALHTGRAKELEAYLEPLVLRWINESIEELSVSDQQREDAISSCQVEVCHQ